MACTTDPHLQMSSATFSTHHQYIHCTGNCFILIPTQLDQRAVVSGIQVSFVEGQSLTIPYRDVCRA